MRTQIKTTNTQEKYFMAVPAKIYLKHIFFPFTFNIHISCSFLTHFYKVLVFFPRHPDLRLLLSGGKMCLSFSGFGGETQRRCQKCGESQSDVMAAPVSCFLEHWTLAASTDFYASVSWLILISFHLKLF